MLETNQRSVASIRRLQDAIRYQLGVTYALGEVVKGADAKEMLIRAMQRMNELLELAEKENAR